MLSFFTITLLASLASANASATDDAAAVISRYPQGAVPVNEPILEAIATLGKEGDESDLSLLTDMAAHELGPIQDTAQRAIDAIASRLRLANRAQHRSPSERQLHAWLSNKTLVADDGRRLGRHERRVVAYTSIALGHSITHHRSDWREVAQSLENAGHSTSAIQHYAAAVLAGDFHALPELQAFGLNPEILALGLFVSLPTEAQDSSPLSVWLRENGTAETVAVFSDRAVQGTALQRAIALDALSEMIRAGHLTRESTAQARIRLQRSTLDPHHDVRTLARTALVELDH